MRFFIALDIPERNKRELESIQRQLNELVPNILLTDLEKLHLTIAFIGEQDERLVEHLAKIINEAIIGISPFLLTPCYIDGFPNIHKAHTFWMGVKGDTDKLLIIRERVKDGLKKLGLETDERRFVPHIALGKIKNFELREGQERALEKLDTENLSPITVDAIKLYESIPNHGFHNHNTLAEAKL